MPGAGTIGSVSARTLVVVSGLAASGKSTVARALARGLDLPLLDKDDVLEALFDSLGCADLATRERLSRAADDVLLTVAAASPAAVAVNWWHFDTAPARLTAAADALVEVWCACPPEVAAERYAARRRHPGHLDHLRVPDAATMAAADRGPLGVGPLVRVDTDGPVDETTLVAQVRAHLGGRGLSRG